MRRKISILTFFIILVISQAYTAQAGAGEDCIIPPSGPWPPCTTGGGTGGSGNNDCVIPPSGPWPPCATGGNETTHSDNPITQLTYLPRVESIMPDSVVAHNGKIYYGSLRSKNIARTYDLGFYELNVTDGSRRRMSIPTVDYIERSFFELASVQRCGGNLFISTSDHLWVVNAQNQLVQLTTQGMKFAVESNGRCFFAHMRRGTETRLELWRSDGTVSGTVRIDQWGLEPSESGLFDFATLNNGNFVFVKGSTDPASSTPTQVWISDGFTVAPFALGHAVFGVAGNTVFAGDPFRQPHPGHWSAYDQAGNHLFEMWMSHPIDVGRINNRIIFSAREYNSTVDKLWISDGTQAGTTVLRSPLSPISMGIAYQGKFYFGASADHVSRKLWVTDGTAQGTHPVNLTGNDFHDPHHFTINSGWLYFIGRNSQNQQELWRLNGGTPQQLLTTANQPFGVISTDHALITIGSAVYFVATDSQPHLQLWRLDLNGGSDGNGDCVIPPSGPWPPCATGGTPPPANDDCVIPPSGPWPLCAR